MLQKHILPFSENHAPIFSPIKIVY